MMAIIMIIITTRQKYHITIIHLLLLLLFSDDAENQAAFMKHFQDQVHHYSRVIAINVVDNSGKEKIIADTFLKHILLYNSPDLMYVAFDFHEYW